jgi:hypothetical protein
MIKISTDDDLKKYLADDNLILLESAIILIPIEINGYIRAYGDISARDISARDIIARDIRARDIRAYGNIRARDISAAGDIIARDIRARDISARDICAAGDISARDIRARDISARDIIARDIRAARDIIADSAKIGGILYWHSISAPRIRGKFEHKLILPPEWQRQHYADRLGMSLDGLCYKKIVEAIKPRVAEFLARPGLLPIEIMMLESIRDFG